VIFEEKLRFYEIFKFENLKQKHEMQYLVLFEEP